MKIEEKVEKIKEHYSDPENFGPIRRQFMHLYFIMNGEELQPEVMESFLDMREKVPCGECRGDFPSQRAKYKYDMEMYLREYGASKYGNTLHNLVNSKKSKPLISFEQQLDIELDKIKKKTST